ncbi:hypothetical protein K9N50_12260 [bacterium]|nr:hypothetical protein [bacterium]
MSVRFSACPIIVNSSVPSGLDAIKSQCDLTVSAYISYIYKLPGHIRCTADLKSDGNSTILIF